MDPGQRLAAAREPDTKGLLAGRQTVDPFAVAPEGLNRQSELFGNLAAEEAADTVCLPASGFHQSCECRSFRSTQHPQDQLHFALAGPLALAAALFGLLASGSFGLQ